MGKPNLTNEQINALITIFEDDMLSIETSRVAAGTLTDHAASISDSLLGNQRIRNLFEQATSSYLEEDELAKSTRSILSVSLPYLMQKRELTEWFQKNIYPNFLRIAQDPKASEPLRQRAIDTLARVARLSDDPDISSQIIDELLEIYLKNHLNEKFSVTVKVELEHFEPKFQLQIIEKIRQHTKTEEQRTLAEELLRALIKNWWSKDLSRIGTIIDQEHDK